MTITLSEAESRRIVARHGVPVSPFASAPSTDELAEAVLADDQVGFPLAVKLCGRSIAHKTERGLVRLGVPDRDSLTAASDELLAAATPDDGPVEVLATSMVTGSRELIAGVTLTDQFGLVVMLGVGGVLAEAIADVAFRLLPISPVDAEDLIDDLAGQTLLGEFRGEPALDRGALVDTLTALAATATETPGIVSIDLNPLIIDAGRPVAVDALVEISDPNGVTAS